MRWLHYFLFQTKLNPLQGSTAEMSSEIRTVDKLRRLPLLRKRTNLFIFASVTQLSTFFIAFMFFFSRRKTCGIFLSSIFALFPLVAWTFSLIFCLLNAFNSGFQWSRSSINPVASWNCSRICDTVWNLLGKLCDIPLTLRCAGCLHHNRTSKWIP